MKIASLLLLLTVALGSGLARSQEGEAVAAPAPAARTVFLLRHAETVEGGGDRMLSDAGQRRAIDLARLLSTAGVTQLYSSPYKRTKATLMPLAEALDLTIEAVDPGDPAEQLGLLADLPPGSVAVVCGHSNTTPVLARALGAGELGDLVEYEPYGDILREDAFDRLFIATIPADSLDGSVVELRYGAGAPAADVVKSMGR